MAKKIIWFVFGIIAGYGLAFLSFFMLATMVPGVAVDFRFLLASPIIIPILVVILTWNRKRFFSIGLLLGAVYLAIQFLLHFMHGWY